MTDSILASVQSTQVPVELMLAAGVTAADFSAADVLVADIVVADVTFEGSIGEINIRPPSRRARW